MPVLGFGYPPLLKAILKAFVWSDLNDVSPQLEKPAYKKVWCYFCVECHMKRWSFLRGSVEPASDLRKQMETSNWVMTLLTKGVAGLPVAHPCHVCSCPVLLKQWGIKAETTPPT